MADRRAAIRSSARQQSEESRHRTPGNVLDLADCLPLTSCRAILCAVFGVLFFASPAAAEARKEPSFMHGVGQVISGIVFELPKTVLDATLSGPPVVGTAVGLLAGTSRAIQKTVGGVVEMSEGFDPFGTKRRR